MVTVYSTGSSQKDRPVSRYNRRCLHTQLVELGTLSVLDRRMAIDIVALLRMEIISIIRVCVVNEGLLRATRLSVECNSLPVARSESVLLVRLESLNFGIASCVVIDSESLFRASAVTASVGLDTNGQGALSEEGCGDEKLGEMHIE